MLVSIRSGGTFIRLTRLEAYSLKTAHCPAHLDTQLVAGGPFYRMHVFLSCMAYEWLVAKIPETRSLSKERRQFRKDTKSQRTVVYQFCYSKDTARQLCVMKWTCSFFEGSRYKTSIMQGKGNLIFIYLQD